MARRANLGLVLISCLMVVVGCGGEDDPLAPPPVDPVDPAPPTLAIPQILPPSALQSVMSQIILPTNGTEHSLDLDGDGVVDNQVGRLLGLLKSELEIDLQPTLDAQLQAGKAIVLFDLLASSLWSEEQAVIHASLGRDLDDDATNNFSGVEPFQALADVLHTSTLPGAISAGPPWSTTPSYPRVTTISAVSSGFGFDTTIACGCPIASS